jgi:hypothetical protein
VPVGPAVDEVVMNASTPTARPRWVIALVSASLVVLLVVGLWVLLPAAPTAPGGPTDPQTAPGAPDGQGVWPLTGEPVETVPARPALLVKVSNSPEARPQTGLDVADVVYEEVTEHGITRFVAVFHSELPEVVGSVRSARPVDAQIASGFGRPGLAFSGARPEVLALLARSPVVTATEGAPGFFRDTGRYASHPYAPHDLFLRVPESVVAATASGAAPLTDIGWAFDATPPSGGGPGDALEVRMSERFTTGWDFDAEAGVYRRQQGGAPFAVTGPGRIGAANVVVLAVRHYVGASGYPETDVLGTGDGLVLRDGRRYEVTWHKPTATAALELRTTSGDPFPFARGRTWILLPDRLPPAEAAPAG